MGRIKYIEAIGQKPKRGRPGLTVTDAEKARLHRLYIGQGLSVRAVGGCLGIGEAAVRRRLRRLWFDMDRDEIVVPRANGEAAFSGFKIKWLSAFNMDKMVKRGRLSIHLQNASQLSKEWGEGQEATGWNNENKNESLAEDPGPS